MDLKLPSTVDLLQPDVFLRFLASQKSIAVDRGFVEAIWTAGRVRWDDVPERVSQPTIISALTQTPIAHANNVWKEFGDRLLGRKELENGLARFRLDDDGDDKWFSLVMNTDTSLPPFSRRHSEGLEKSWLSQALSIFHSCGISLEEDLSVYKLLWQYTRFEGPLDTSPSKAQQQRQQPIYIFVRLPPDCLNGEIRTTSLHFWSFHEDGRDSLSTELCGYLGLPVELHVSNRVHSYSLPNEHYELFHRYQLLRGFDPTTTSFARYLGYDSHLFQPVSNSDRFTDVHEDQNPLHPTSSHDLAQFAIGSDSNTRNQPSILDAIFASNSRVQDAVREGDCNGHRTIENSQLFQQLPKTLPHFTGLVGLHSPERTHPQQLCQSQVHPQGCDDDNQTHFPYPHLSQTFSLRDTSLSVPDTPAQMDSNLLSLGHTPMGWPGISQYLSNKCPIPSVNTAAVNRHDRVERSSEFVNTFFDSSPGPITLTQLKVPRVVPMPDSFDESFTFSSCRASDADPPDTGYTDSSVDTTRITSGLSCRTAQSIEWSGPSESATANNSFDGYPMDVDTDTDFSCSMSVD
ncbi:hypothetical protein PM082_009263 [Marasmius tenuissimus]|nr:hypothetical protein PM082_009263 [Marasmius tenuissimus]